MFYNAKYLDFSSLFHSLKLKTTRTFTVIGVFSLHCVFSLSSYAQPKYNFAYQLEKPDHLLELPAELAEISSISLSPNPALLCAVQDETGTLYFIHKKDGSIEKTVSFRPKGDFEGIEMVDSVAFALKSDGILFKISNIWSEKPEILPIATSLTKEDDVEGLGYDPIGNRLLLACKGNPDDVSARGVYAFSLESLSLEGTPVFELDPNAIECFSEKKESQAMEGNCFSPSALAVHPISGDIYLLSTTRKRMVVLDRTGKILHVAKLNKKIMPQPEGMVFEADGTLWISSEAKNEQPGLLMSFKPIQGN